MKQLKLIYLLLPLIIGIQFAFTKATRQRMRKQIRVLFKENMN